MSSILGSVGEKLPAERVDLHEGNFAPKCLEDGVFAHCQHALQARGLVYLFLDGVLKHDRLECLSHFEELEGTGAPTRAIWTRGGRLRSVEFLKGRKFFAICFRQVGELALEEYLDTCFDWERDTTAFTQLTDQPLPYNAKQGRRDKEGVYAHVNEAWDSACGAICVNGREHEVA